MTNYALNYSIFAGGITLFVAGCSDSKEKTTERPNILIAISDDQSYIHSGPYGILPVRTPVIDSMAKQGVLFTNAFTASPMCTVSRASLLTGRNPWQNGEAGQHNCIFPGELTTFPDLLQQAGYYTGFTGKGWAPGNWAIGGRSVNPAGPEFNQLKLNEKPASGISDIDYCANFKAFLKNKPDNTPFYFWYGAEEPHDPWEKGSGLKAGYSPDGFSLPANFSDTSRKARSSHLDYMLEVEWFDIQLGKIIEVLKESGEFDNTIIIITGDNGSPIPGGKTNLYDLGTHVPMVIVWGDKVKPSSVIEALISQIDIAPTLLEAAGLSIPKDIAGVSFLNLLTPKKNAYSNKERQYIFSAQERSSHQRTNNLGYPMRAVRSKEFLYIRNFAPDRYPNYEGKKAEHYALSNYWNRLRPAEELYHVPSDPFCMNNIATQEGYESVKLELSEVLNKTLHKEHDPRVSGCGDIYEGFPRFGPFEPEIGGYKVKGEYNPDFLIDIPKGVFVSGIYYKALQAKKMTDKK